MGFCKRKASMQVLMKEHGITGISAAEKNGIIPEIIHHRQMLFPIHPGYIIKDGAQEIVGFHFIIKSVYQPLYIPSCSDIFFHTAFTHSRCGKDL
jgi:hypothetical protein